MIYLYALVYFAFIGFNIWVGIGLVRYYWLKSHNHLKSRTLTLPSHL